MSHLDWKFLGALGVVVAYLIYSIGLNRLNFLSGASAAVLLIAIAGFALSYVRLRANALETLRKRKGEPAVLAFGDLGLSIHSKVGAVNLEWSDIEQLREFRTMALLMFKGGGYVVLPSSCTEASDLSVISSNIARGKNADA